MPDPLKVSFSRLALFSKCPRAFRYRYIQQMGQDEGNPLYRQAGVLFHQATEHDTNPHDPEIMEQAIRYKGRLYGKDVIQRALNVLPAYASFLQADPYTEVVAREHEILRLWEDPETDDQVRFHGFADRVMRGDRGLIIDDWKLGQARPTDVAQLQTYAPMIADQFGEPVSLLRLIYLKQNGNFKVKAFLPRMQLAEVDDLMTDMAQVLYRSGYYPAWGGLTGQCKICSFAPICDWVGMGSEDALEIGGK